jgi:ParB family chromosome partitioning protein
MLSKLEDDNKIIELANKIINEDLTVRETEAVGSDEKKKKTIAKKESNNDYKYVEDILREKLDTRVKVKDMKIEITFTNTADLNRILEVLNIKE